MLRYFSDTYFGLVANIQQFLEIANMETKLYKRNTKDSLKFIEKKKKSGTFANSFKGVGYNKNTLYSLKGK